jgi:hypothetical protein
MSKDDRTAIYHRRINRVVESGVEGWGAIMEIVARRKSSTKGNDEETLEIEISTGPQFVIWRLWSWRVFMALGCIFMTTAMLWGQWSSYGKIPLTPKFPVASI